MMICKDCNRELPEEMFYRKANGALSNGRSCKDCVKARTHSHREQNREETIRKARERYKNDEEYRKGVLSYQSGYRKEHNEEKREYAKSYRGNNKELVNKKIADYRKTPKGKHGYRQKDYRKRYLELNEGAEPIGNLSYEEWLSVLEKFNYRCANCGTENEITIDHIIPISRGGANTIENVQPLCRSCNSKKKTETIRY